jgi:DNA repair ATPase RecN
MADSEHGRTSSFAGRARAALTTAGKDERLQQAAALTKDVAARAEEASKHVSRMVGQADAWDELRGDVEVLTELARAHHALIIDLIDRVAALEGPVGTQPGGSRDG